MVTTEKILESMNSWHWGELIVECSKRCFGGSSRSSMQAVFYHTSIVNGRISINITGRATGPLPERALQEGGAPLHHADQAGARLEARPRPRPSHAHWPPEHRQHGGGRGRHCHTLCIACINYHYWRMNTIYTQVTNLVSCFIWISHIAICLWLEINNINMIVGNGKGILLSENFSFTAQQFTKIVKYVYLD